MSINQLLQYHRHAFHIYNVLVPIAFKGFKEKNNHRHFSSVSMKVTSLLLHSEVQPLLVGSISCLMNKICTSLLPL